MYIFIVENEQLAKALIRDHFEADGIMYAEVVEDVKRARVIKALETIHA